MITEEISMSGSVAILYTDFVCPWCYIIEKELEPFITREHLNIEYVYYPLHPETPDEGMTLNELFSGRNVDVEKDQQAIRLKAQTMGLKWTTRKHTYNSRNAQLLAKYLEGSEYHNDFRGQVFDAYFGRGKNISDPGLLSDIFLTLNIAGRNVRELLIDPDLNAILDADWNRCRSVGITGVPTLYYEDRYCVGAQNSDILRRLFDSGG
ncbi:MAG: DsbA family oxidoreductase [Pirellulaceae bacterium]